MVLQINSANQVELQPKVKVILWLAFALMFLHLTGCEGERVNQSNDSNSILINAWFHSGQASERRIMKQQVDRFNKNQDKVHVMLTILPEGSYNTQVQAAALAGKLPDILEFDGPFLYNYIWQGHLQPLDNLLPQQLKDDIIPTIIQQGTYGGHLYSIGTFDSGLGLFGLRSKLNKVGARIPFNPADAWTIDEFNTLLTKLAQNDEDGKVLDLKVNYQGEWFTYAFSPILSSAGADLLNRDDFQSASGILNSPAAINAFRQVQSWFANGYVDENVDDASFLQEKVALSWVGHWEYPRYSAAHGDDLILLPLPDFGKGSRSGQGSWNWGITKDCKSPEAAAEFIQFILQPEEILAMANANGAVPATRTAIRDSALYAENGPLRLFTEQLINGYTIPRPRTPAYPLITSVFQQTFDDIRNYADVKTVLNDAVTTINQDISDNKGYALP